MMIDTIVSDSVERVCVIDGEHLRSLWEGGSFPRTFLFDAADRLVTMTEGANLTKYAWTKFGAMESEVTGSEVTTYAYSGQDQLVGVAHEDFHCLQILLGGVRVGTYGAECEAFRQEIACLQRVLEGKPCS